MREKAGRPDALAATQRAFPEGFLKSISRTPDARAELGIATTRISSNRAGAVRTSPTLSALVGPERGRNGAARLRELRCCGTRRQDAPSAGRPLCLLDFHA